MSSQAPKTSWDWMSSVYSSGFAVYSVVACSFSFSMSGGDAKPVREARCNDGNDAYLPECGLSLGGQASSLRSFASWSSILFFTWHFHW